MTERLHRPGLWVATCVAAVAIAAAVVAPTLLAGGPHTYQVAVTGEGAASVAGAVERAADVSDIHVRVIETQPSVAVRALASGSAALVVEDGARILVLHRPDPGSALATLSSGIAASVGLEASLERSGLPAASILRVSDARPLPVVATHADRAEQDGRTTALACVLLIFLLLQQCGTAILTGVAEEKSNGVVDVLWGALSGEEMLAGKVIGIGSVVVAQSLSLLSVALVAGVATGSHVLDGRSSAVVAVSLGWLLCGYLLYCTLFAAAGSMSQRAEDAQHLAVPVQLPLTLGYLATIAVVTSGSLPSLTSALGYVPLTAPLVMPALYGVGRVGVVGVATSYVITLVVTAVVLRFGSRLYARTITGASRPQRVRRAQRAPVRSPALTETPAGP